MYIYVYTYICVCVCVCIYTYGLVRRTHELSSLRPMLNPSLNQQDKADRCIWHLLDAHKGR